MAVDEETRNQIVTLDAKGRSRRQIAQRLGISRNTVRRVLHAVAKARRQGKSALPPAPVRRESKLVAYDSFIKQTLEEFPDISAVRMLEELETKGYDGGYTIVKDLLRRIRPKPKKKPAQRIETDPGEQGQQDWSPYVVNFIEDGQQKVSAFSLVLSYCRRQHLRFGLDESFLTMIRQHRAAFERFGGVPKEILYDGQKVVLIGREAGRPIYNPRFLAFATYYGFRPYVLPPRRPDLKGKVERPFEYVEYNLFNGRKFRSLKHLNEVAEWWLTNRADIRIHGRLKERPIDRFVQEAPHLLPLPARPYDTAEVGYRVVSIEGLVSWDATP